MGKYSYFLKNIGLLTISSFATKLLNFLLVPLYTNILTTTEYGIFDLVYTTVSLMIPIFTLDINDSVIRFTLDKNCNKGNVLSIGIKLSLASTLLVVAFVTANSFFGFWGEIKPYSVHFLLFYIGYLFIQFVQSFARGADKILELSITGIIQTVLLVALNILFLVVFNFGIVGYFCAFTISNTASGIILCILIKIWTYFGVDDRRKKVQKEMIQYSRPLVLNMVSWWINNASDRYIVTWLCGVSVNGVYSVGYKIPSILNVFQTIFNQAWQLSTVKELDDADAEQFYTRIYVTYNFLIVICCSVLIIVSKGLAYLLYAKEFFDAWIYVPFLLVSIVFGAMSGVIGGIFQAYRDSKTQSRSTLIGAGVNIIANILLVKLLGAIGATIATAISYFIVFIVRKKYVKRYININNNIIKDGITYAMLLTQSILIISFSSFLILYTIEILLFAGIIFVNKKTIKNICYDILNKVDAKRR